MVNKKQFFQFYFFNKDFPLNIQVKVLNFSTDVKNIVIEGTMSQIFLIAPTVQQLPLAVRHGAVTS